MFVSAGSKASGVSPASTVLPQPATSTLVNGLVREQLDTQRSQLADRATVVQGDGAEDSTAIARRLQVLENQNNQLKLLFEKLDVHTQRQEEDMETLKAENCQLQDRLAAAATGGGSTTEVRQANTELEQENSALCERLVSLEENLRTLEQEKQSLVSTLQLLQEELLESEQCRQTNLHTSHS